MPVMFPLIPFIYLASIGVYLEPYLPGAEDVFYNLSMGLMLAVGGIVEAIGTLVFAFV